MSPARSTRCARGSAPFPAPGSRTCGSWPAPAQDREDTVLDAAAAILQAATPTAALNALSGQLMLALRPHLAGRGRPGPWSPSSRCTARCRSVAVGGRLRRGLAERGRPGQRHHQVRRLRRGRSPRPSSPSAAGGPAPIRRRERHEIAMLVVVTARFIDALGGASTPELARYAVAPVPVPRSVRGMLRIGFVGTGLIAWAHGLGLQAMIDGGVIDAAVTVVHDRSDKRAQRFAAALGAEAVGGLDGPDRRCDAVWVCTPDGGAPRARSMRPWRPAAPSSARSRWPPTWPAPRSLVDAVAAAGVPAQSGLVLRSAPVFRRCATLVRVGDTGPADGRHVPRRPVLPDSGDLRLEVAGRRRPRPAAAA